MKRFLLASLMVLISGTFLFAQERSVSGTVKDAATGEGIPGVNILIQGTTSGSVSDIDGKFQLQVPSGAVTLVLSYVGYKTLTVPVAATQTTIDVALQSDVTALSEVVVVGYGTQEKKEITSSVANVTTKDFNKGNVNDPVQLIQGKVAGLSISKAGSNPNQGFDIRLRGISTVGANSSPLIIVDGVIGANLNSVDPNDIASIDILKDASAAAIYGTRGSAGVILITTKKGKAGSFNIDYNGYVSMESPAKYVPVMTSSEWRDFRKVVPGNPGTDFLNDTNWLKAITQTALSHVHNLSMSGGSKSTTYRASINLRDLQGVEITTGSKELNTRFNIEQKALNDKLTISFDAAGTYKKITYGGGTDPNTGQSAAFRYATIYNPTAPIKVDANTKLPAGYQVSDFAIWDGYFNQVLFDYYNPMQIIQENSSDGIDKRINIAGRANYEIVKGLNVDAFYSLQNDGTWRGQYYDKNSFWTGRDRNGNANQSYNEGFNQLFEATGNWSGDLGSGINLSAVAGYSYQDFSYQGFSARGGNFLTDAFGYNNLGAAKEFSDGLGSVSSYKNGYKIIAFFGRANLNINETYFLSATLRHEGSTRFGANNHWGNFPAVSAGVELANFLNVSAIDNLKLRGSYGITGQLPPSNYLSLDRWTKVGNFYYQGAWLSSYGPNFNANPDLRWEKLGEIDVGLDYSFFGSKLFGAIDYYNKTTTDLILNYNVPQPPNLAQRTWSNVGKIVQSGLELAVSWKAVDLPSITYTPSFTYTNYLKNEIVSLSNSEFQYGVNDLDDYGSPGQNGTPLVRVEEGKPMGQIFGLVFDHIDETGNWVFKDVNGDGVASGGNEDRTVIGNGLPKWEAGLNNSFTFGKRFDLNFFFRGVFGHDLINQFRGFYEVPQLMTSYNILKSSENVKSPGGVLLSTTSGKFSTYNTEKASFVKLDNFALGYTVPVKDGASIRSLRVYLSGNNLMCITGYTGVDPEVRYTDPEDTNDGVLVPGVDRRNTWVRSYSLSLGVQLGL
jgi:iron complex outermembrane receptor protein